MKGWIILPRNIREKEIYRNKNAFKLLLHFLLIANYKDSEDEDIRQNRGIVTTDYESLRMETGLELDEVLKSIVALMEADEILVDRHKETLVISVLNYEQYQNKNVKGGWVKIHRCIIDWVWYRNANVCQVFIYLLLDASSINTCYENSIIHKGSTHSSVRVICEQTGLSDKETRNAIANLEKTNNVTKIRKGRYTVYSISKYNEWQLDKFSYSDNIICVINNGEKIEKEISEERIQNEKSVIKGQPEDNQRVNRGQVKDNQRANGGQAKNKQRANVNNNNIQNYKKGEYRHTRMNQFNNYHQSTSEAVVDEFERLFMLEVNSAGR